MKKIRDIFRHIYLRTNVRRDNGEFDNWDNDYIEALTEELIEAIKERDGYVLGEDEPVSPIRLRAEAAEIVGSVQSASEGRNKLKAEQRKRAEETL